MAGADRSTVSFESARSRGADMDRRAEVPWALGASLVGVTLVLFLAIAGTLTLTTGWTNDAGNVGTPKSIPVDVAVMGPTTTASVSGTLLRGGWYDTPVSIWLNATDPSSSIASTNYRINGGAWHVYAGDFTLATDGNYTVDAYSVNTAGITGPTTTLTLHLDGTPPTVAASVSGSVGAHGWYVSDATVAITASDAMSGLASILYLVDAGSFLTYTGPFRVSEGAHTIFYQAFDVAGNTAQTDPLTVNVDMTPPGLSGLAPSGQETASAVTFTWTGADATSGIDRYAISVDGGAFQSVGTSESATLTLADGTHTITVRATDAAGNTATATTTVTVDTNSFSFTGPYAGAPTFALILIGVAVILVAVLRIRRRKQGVTAPPQEPPAPPNP